MRKTGELQTVEWIPSRDVKQYLREIGYKFTDFEKAAIVYNSCRGWETIQRQLKQIKKETQDRTLAIQIEERLCYDEIILSQIKESTSKEIFLFRGL